jgi:hypothetical protein
MKSTPEALELMGRYLDGQATAEETARMEALMMADAALRSEFLACARVEASLRTALVGERVSSPRRTTRWRQVWIPLAAAAAVVIGAFVFYAEISERLGHPAAVARFGQLDGCRWMDPATRVLGGDGIAVGQRVELAAGRAELHFATGARVTLLGPAIFELRSKNSGFLTLGEVRVAAETAESKGFILATPTSNFVDIGTAFSAGVSADGLSRLEVSEGIVDVVFREHAPPHRLRAGETMFVEPGERKILTRIEAGDGTTAFRFPTIPPPSADDYADRSQGHASIHVTRGKLGRPGGAAEVLLDGGGQSKQDSPRESVHFSPEPDGAFVVDLGRVMPVRRIHSYSWHQHQAIAAHRERAMQRFTLHGWTDDAPPDFSLPPEKAGWTRIARVNTDESLHVEKRLDRPAQQACAITSESGDIGHFRYLLWVVDSGTFYGEIDVFTNR